MGIVLLRLMTRIARQVGALSGIQLIKPGDVGLRTFGCIQVLVVAGAVEIHREAQCTAHVISL
ncbi:hypothetical protein D9M68_820530 [compost metagenome]